MKMELNDEEGSELMKRELNDEEGVERGREG